MTERRDQYLLLIEDSDEDFETLKWVMGKLSINIYVCRYTNGDEALNYLHACTNEGNNFKEKLPKVILLDLNLPGTDGRDVLRHLKQDTILKNIPVVVFTTSSNPKDIEMCYQDGVNGYMIKPIDIEQLIKTIQVFFDYWFKVSALPNSFKR
ncbi:response regulator [Cronbergia sp. UHCC 0137]|uniref:response regulator n=1 Tax=Cronbergia sp. UHCC 0137 TaxID=3110239 RepID=UPI002B219F13|nr:response regulator [Cronbergia sp. UHCC 0137]MEA5617378.1 response regulator [Cronbergia sp. UHCC 0137]